MPEERICQYGPCSKEFIKSPHANIQYYCSQYCYDRHRSITHKEQKSEYNKQWYKNNTQRRKASDSAYHWANKEKMNAKSRAYYAANRERLVADKSAYTAANRETLNAKQRIKYNEKLKARRTVIIICNNAECGKEFLVSQKRSQSGQRFCSSKCANHAWRESHREELKEYGRTKYKKNIEKRRAYNKIYRESHYEELLSKDRIYNSTHKEERRAYRSQYYVNNRAEILIKMSNYYATHREDRDVYRRQYYVENYEEIMSYQINYRNTHREQMRLKDAAYRKANPEKVRSNLARYRARRAAVSINDLTDKQWQEIKAANHYRCVYCPDDCWRCRKKKHDLTQDHITPLSKGGNHTSSNILPACKSCNARKGNRSPLKPVQPLLLTTT